MKAHDLISFILVGSEKFSKFFGFTVNKIKSFSDFMDSEFLRSQRLKTLNCSIAKRIDEKALQLSIKLSNLKVNLQKVQENASHGIAEFDQNCSDIEQHLYSTWQLFYKKHPLLGKFLTFIICAIATAIITTLTENLLSDSSEQCTCNCQHQPSYHIENCSNFTINNYEFSY